MVKILHDPNNESGNKAMNTTVNMANQPKKVSSISLEHIENSSTQPLH